MITGEENAQFELDDLLKEILTDQMLHQAQIAALTSLMKAMAKAVFEDDKVLYKEVIETYEAAFKKEAERLQNENVVIQQIIKNKIREELGDIIDF